MQGWPFVQTGSFWAGPRFKLRPSTSWATSDRSATSSLIHELSAETDGWSQTTETASLVRRRVSVGHGFPISTRSDVCGHQQENDSAMLGFLSASVVSLHLNYVLVCRTVKLVGSMDQYPQHLNPFDEDGESPESPARNPHNNPPLDSEECHLNES